MASHSEGFDWEWLACAMVRLHRRWRAAAFEELRADGDSSLSGLRPQ